MKRITWILMISLLCISFGKAEEVTWYDWNEAQQLTEYQQKPIMVFVYASWCHLCKRMDSKVFTDEEVAAMLNEHFIPVKLDAESKGDFQKDGDSFTGMELLAELTENNFRGIPAYLFITGETGVEVRLEAGLKDPQEMKALLQEYE
jgi:thiol:disulfide interchange protein